MLSGALVYFFLAIVARSLPPEEYAWFGAYWSLTLVIGFGAFLPLELELARLVHLRPAGAPLPPGTARLALALTGLTGAAVLAGWPALSSGLGGRTGLLFALLAVCVTAAGQFVLRGLFLGRGQVGRHGIVMLVDAVLRVAGAAVVIRVVRGPTAVQFGWTLVGAIALAHLPLLAVLVLRRRSTDGTEGIDATEGADGPDGAVAGPRLRVGPVGHLMLATLCAQALLNAAPVLVTGAAATGEHALAAAFVASFTLVRLPLFVAVPLQSALLPALTDLHADTNRTRQRRLVLLLVAGVCALAAAAGVVGGLVGPAAVGLVFGDRYALTSGTLALLAVGSLLYLGLLVTTQALVAGERHRASAVAWVGGVLVAVLLFAVVPGLVARASLAFTAGSGAALLLSAAALLRPREATA